MEEMSDAEARKTQLWEMIRDIRVAMLTTIDDDGSLRSRPMANHQESFDGVLWFFTPASSHKVFEIEGHHEVNVAFAEPATQTFVSATGTAQLVRDREKVDQLWHDYLTTWFPGGKDDPDLALLRVDVDKAEYWDSTSSAMQHVFRFLSPVRGIDPSDASDHHQVKFR